MQTKVFLVRSKDPTKRYIRVATTIRNYTNEKNVTPGSPVLPPIIVAQREIYN